MAELSTPQAEQGWGTWGHCGVFVTWGVLVHIGKGFPESFWSLDRTAAILSSDVIRSSAGAEGIVQGGSWLKLHFHK